MGAHYRSIQIKGENRDAIIATAAVLVRKQKAKLLVGPELNGWTGIYLDDSVPSENFAAAVARELATSVLELLVHDSDIFIYNFYRGDRLIDEYSSCPDYFEEVSPADHERLKGKPALFHDLLGSNTKVTTLAALLAAPDDDGFEFAENRMEKFAELLGIQNTFASYDYLTHGEWAGIQGRKLFVHIPDQTAEKAAARAEAAALRAEVKRLRKERILCFEALPPSKGGYVLGLGEAIFDPLRGGVLFKWGAYAANPQEPKLFHAKPPWTSEPEPVEIPPSSTVPTSLVFSRSGMWFAYSDGQVRLWDWAQKTLVGDIELHSFPQQFSADEKSLLCANQQGFEILCLESRKIIATAPVGTQRPHFLAWHPSGRFVVNRHRQDQLGIVDLDARKLVKVLYSGTVTDWSNLAAVFSGTLKQAGLTDEQMGEMKEGFIRGSDEPFSLKFSPDGKLLFCATTRGLRVLEWEKVLAAEKSTPAPVFAASAAPLPPLLDPAREDHYINFAYDVVFDQDRNRLLFCGLDGTVRYFNLDGASTGILLKPPGKDSICRLQMSADREFIYCYCTPSAGHRHKKPDRIQVWNYRLLRNAAGME